MTLYVVGSLLYFHTYSRDSARGKGWAALLVDGALWANVWNVAGSVSYAVSVYYGLAIRIHTAQMEQLTWTVNEERQGGVVDTAPVNNGTVAADDLSDLSEWQRALFGLTFNQRMLMSAGDAMYFLCAVMMEVAARQDERKRKAGKDDSKKDRTSPYKRLAVDRDDRLRGTEALPLSVVEADAER